MTIREAIEASRTEDRTVHLPWNSARYNKLEELCDGKASTENEDEFWGADWRIHLDHC